MSTPILRSDETFHDRMTLAAAFLTQHGWHHARRVPLAGDASDRRYERLFTDDKQTAILMDTPPGSPDNPADFVRIGDYLRSIGLSAPQIYAQDLKNGFLLLEDLGDNIFSSLLEQDQKEESRLYRAAVDVLCHLHSHAPPEGVPNLSADEWARATTIAFDFYTPVAGGARLTPSAMSNVKAVLSDTLKGAGMGHKVLILRDYHAENLLDLPQRRGVARTGVLDFQLAQIGAAEYDLVSLIQDARRDVSRQLQQEMVTYYADATGQDLSRVNAALAVWGAQRALRILGVFTRLCVSAAKPRYVSFIPRVWEQLQQNLAHPALRDLRPLCDQYIPAPNHQILKNILSQCPKTTA